MAALAPASAVRPSAAIAGFSALGVCDGLHLDGGDSTGSGGRALSCARVAGRSRCLWLLTSGEGGVLILMRCVISRYAWSLAATTSTDEHSVAALVRALNASSLRHGGGAYAAGDTGAAEVRARAARRGGAARAGRR